MHAVPSVRPTPPWLLLLLAIGFAVAHTQSSLFYSNQNQYLLHGLASAGYGHLSNDWLANTNDPTPLFSICVCACYRAAGLWPLQVVYFAMLCVYFLFAWSLARAIANLDSSIRSFLGVTALLTLAHAAGPRLLSVWLTGVDYPWFLQAGVAGQYALGPGLQPSCFAVLLFGSLAVYASGRPVTAAALAASAAWFHATYLLPAAFLTIGYIAKAGANRNWSKAIRIGTASLLVALPAVVYVLVVFRPDDPEAFAKSQRILATVRIPHHSVITRWFDWVAAVQLVWIIFGLFLTRRTTLFVPLCVATILALIISFIQFITANPTLALLFPWRLSIVLVPFTTILVSALFASRIPVIVSILIFVTLLIAGLIISIGAYGYKTNEAEIPMLEFVRTHAKAGDYYLIPTKFPEVGSGRGSMSASFTPPPRPVPGSNLIPIDLQQFRLTTGAAIYVDFKSVPYGPQEVLEWERRMKQVERWYADTDWEQTKVIDELKAVGITHVVFTKSQTVKSKRLVELFSDEAYVVFRIE